MVLEIAEIEVKAGSEADFEAGVARAAPLFESSLGCHGLELQRSIEFPQKYRLIVTWETVENHMVDFRGSEKYQQWRALVSDCFAAPPKVEHTAVVVKAF